MKCSYFVEALKVFLLVLVLSGCRWDTWELGNGYVLADESIFYAYPSKDDVVRPIKFIVCPRVLKYEINNDYIFVYQHVDKEYTKEVYKGKEMDEKTKKSLRMRNCYWIIDTKKDVVYGPYNRTEYKKKKKEIIAIISKEKINENVFLRIIKFF